MKTAALNIQLERDFGHRRTVCPATVFSFLPLGRHFSDY